ncbi:MAG: hypothetical protein WC593_14030 [Methanoregula sp.]
MSPDPEPEEPGTPENFNDLYYFSEFWQDLPWSPWVPFDAPREFFYIPKEPGIYRIRPVGKDFLVYISETNRTLHQRLGELRQSLRRTDLMPWNDPDTSAPPLWAWRDAERYQYECSAAPLDASPAGRRAMESFLIYQYRQEVKESPLCNFGRFHPRYRRSTNKSGNLRGGKLLDNQKDNPAGWPSIPPLSPAGKPGDPDWMELEWTPAKPFTPENIETILPGAGLYLLTDAGSQEILFIGQAPDCKKRLLVQCGKEWDDRTLEFSYQPLGENVFLHNLRELENDLIGNFFEHYRKAPEFQFRASR